MSQSERSDTQATSEQQPEPADTANQADKPTDQGPMQPPTPVARRQLEQFQTVYGPAESRDRLSNVIDIWDAAPKYTTARRVADVTGQSPRLIEKTFTLRGVRFRLTVAPVVFQNAAGEEVMRLPTVREEIVEDALRHLALEQQRGFVGSRAGQPVFGVRFTLHQLRRELARHGHTINHPDLVDALMVLSGCVVEVGYPGQRRAVHRSTILSHLSAVSRDDYRRDPDAAWEAQFHPMVAASLGSIAYRQYDYAVTLGYRTSLARWLHKHLALVFLNAGMTQSLTLTLGEIRDNSGRVNHAAIRRQAQAVETALNELKTGPAPILRAFDRHPIVAQHRLVDVGYTLYPTGEFVKQVMAANSRQRDARLQNQPE